MAERKVERVVHAVPTSDGAGVRLSRAIANAELDHLDPFLLLDEFRSDDPNDYIAGFPDHPHRGFETVTYMLAGKMEHADHAGNRGLLTGGGAQWMTAGRGIIHSETPKQEDGLMWGFQLWVNLPAKHKMTAPRYQDIDPGAIPEVKIEGGSVRVIAGTLRGATGPVQGIVTDPVYLDVRLGAGGRVRDRDSRGPHRLSLHLRGRGVGRGDAARLRRRSPSSRRATSSALPRAKPACASSASPRGP